MPGSAQGEDAGDDDGGDPENQGELNHAGQGAVLRKGAGHAGDAGKPRRAACDLQILNDDPDDFTKAQGDDGQVIPLQPEGWNANQHAKQGRHQPAENQGDG